MTDSIVEFLLLINHTLTQAMFTGGILAITLLLAIIYCTLAAQSVCMNRYLNGKTSKVALYAQLGVCLLAGTVLISTATYKGYVVGAKMIAMW